MRHYIGVDLSKEVSVVCVQREDGKVIISNALVRTVAAAVQAIVNSVPKPRQVTLEESLQAAWIYSVLEPICEKVVVCNPLRNKRLSGEKTSDCEAAYNLSDRLRAGILEGVWHGGDKIQRFRELIRAYETTKSGNIRMKPRVARTRGMVKEYNRTLKYVIKLAATKLAHTDWSDQYLKLVKAGINSSNAKLTLARKLAAIMLHLAKSGEKYDESLVFKKISTKRSVYTNVAYNKK